MNMIQFFGAVEYGLIYALVAIGVYLSFRVLDFPDLTVDGSFPLGAAICAACIVKGVHPAIATLFAMLGGAMCGFVTSYLSTRLKMLNLLSGILTMTALYSINLRIMGKPNVALLGEKTVFTELFAWLKIPAFSFHIGSISFEIPAFSQVLSALIILVFLGGFLIRRFLGTELGLSLRATGSNAKMARAQGINDQRMIQLGLAISNAYVALAGALLAQVQGFSDISMGLGTIIYGLAAVILGEALLPTRTSKQALIACVIGAILYRLTIAFALNINEFGLQASDLNLVTAVLVAFAMVIPSLKQRIRL